MRALGIDVGGTNIKWVVLDLSGVPEILAEGHTPTHADLGPERTLERISDLGREAIASYAPVSCVGVGIPGPLDLDTGRTVFLANLPGWENLPIVEPLARALERPVGLINDARAFTLAELRLGAGRGCRNLVGITLGTGIGGGIVVDGELLLHLSGTVGEIGHLTLVPDGVPCPCGSHGCLERYAAGPAIAHSAGMETAEAVMEAARAGDQRAIEALAQAGTALGIGIANVVITVGPERVVVGGGVAEAGDLILEPARRELRRRVTVVPVERVDVVPAELGPRAGAIGAAVWGATTARR